MSKAGAVLLILAILLVLGGLVQALGDYTIAFADGKVNMFHALRGVAWNLGTLAVANVFAWLARSAA